MFNSTLKPSLKLLAKHLSLALITLCTVFAGVCQAQGLPLLTRHVRAAVADDEAKSVGRLPAAQSLHIDIVLAQHHETELQNFVEQVNDRSSPSYHKFLTPEEFTARFGPTQEEWDAVLAFAKASGFEVVSGSRDAMDLRLIGTVASIERAFHVAMGVYQHATENRTFYAPDREPTVKLPFPLWHISGLDNYSIPRPLLMKRPSGTPVTPATTGSCPSASFCGSDMRAAYYGGTSLTGAGQTVGLLEYYGTDLSDLSTYYSNAHQTQPFTPTIISTDGSSTSCLIADGCDDTEQTLDMTQAMGMAPGMNMLYMYVGSTDTAMISAMTVPTDAPLSRQIGCSWGWSPADPSTLDPYFTKMAAQGQNFFVASGDNSTWCSNTDDSCFPWPADDANVVSVGGTDLITAGAGGAWASETAWADSGGGVSPDSIAIPSWQTSYINFSTCTKCSQTLRNGPDVSANANMTFYVCADQDGCTANTYGGTSFAAPMWAGYLALANQQAAAGGDAIGFIDPIIYPAAAGSNYSLYFHDITSGTSGSNSALPGYDLVTGWGSPNGAGLINLLVSNGTPATITALISGMNPATVGAPVTLTATVSPSPGAAGTMAFTSNGATISGCGAVALTGGVATCNASFSSVGAYSIIAAYSGGAGYLGGNSNIVSQVVTYADTTTLTSNLNPSTYGQSVTLTDTISYTVANATGTFSFSALPDSECDSTPTEPSIEVGGVDWLFASLTDTSQSPNCYDYLGTNGYGGLGMILIGTTVAQTAQNTAAAISGNAALCGYKDPNPGDLTYNTCFYIKTSGNNYATATASGPAVTLTAKVAGAAGNCTGGNCYRTYGWSTGDSLIGYNDYENITPTSGGLSGGLPIPTGTVNFMNGGGSILGCSAQSVASGTAACVTLVLPAGTDSLTAHYSGDSNFAAGTSNTVSQVVNHVTTTTAVTGVSPSSEPYGSGTPTTVTANLSWAGNGTAPTGGLNFAATAGGSYGMPTCSNSSPNTVAATVNAGNQPFAAAFDATNGDVYAANVQGNTVSVIDGSSNTVVATVGVGSLPDAVAFDAANGEVYVANYGDNTVSVIDGSPNAVVDTISVGSHPNAVAFDAANGDVYVANGGSNTVSVISGSTNTVIATVSVGSNPYAAAFDATNGNVYVANLFANTVSVINGSTVVATVSTGSGPVAVAFDAANGYVYVANENDSTMSVIDGSTNTVVATVSVASVPVAIAFDAANGDLYVATYENNSVIVINPSTNTVVATVSVGSGPDALAYDAANGDVYVANELNNTVSVITTNGSPITCTATFTPTVSDAPGTYTVSASYAGDSNYSAASSPQTNNFTITPAATSTALTSTPNASTGGQTVTFTATVSPAPTGATGLGTVTFKANGVTIVTIGLLTSSDGVAKLNDSNLLPSGSPYSVIATYSGTTDLAGSTSNTVMQTVTLEPTTTTLGASTMSPAYGQSVTLTATVSSSNMVTPTGSVIFKNGTASIGTVALTKSGTGMAQAVLNISTLPVAANSITADYTGSSLMQASVSSPATVITVSQVGSTTAVTSSVNPSVYGQTVTFAAIVMPEDGGTATATGTMTFYENGKSIGTLNLSGGKASLPVTTLTPGSYTITATYNGSSNVAGSMGTLTGGPQVVSKAATTTAVTSSSLTVTHGTPVTYTATVTATAPSTTAPTGSVVFYDTFNSVTTELGVGTLSGGKATLMHTYTAAQEGMHSITATYTGSAYVNASPASPAITEMVN